MVNVPWTTQSDRQSYLKTKNAGRTNAVVMHEERKSKLEAVFEILFTGAFGSLTANGNKRSTESTACSELRTLNSPLVHRGTWSTHHSLCCTHKGSGYPIAPRILDLIVVVFFFRSGEKVSMKRAILRAFHLVVRTKVQKSAPRMELFSVLFRDQDEKLGESRPSNF